MGLVRDNCLFSLRSTQTGDCAVALIAAVLFLPVRAGWLTWFSWLERENVHERFLKGLD